MILELMVSILSHPVCRRSEEDSDVISKTHVRLIVANAGNILRPSVKLLYRDIRLIVVVEPFAVFRDNFRPESTSNVVSGSCSRSYRSSVIERTAKHQRHEFSHL